MQSDAEALGQELRKAREARDLTLDRAEQHTRIRVKYLEALEEGNYAALPSTVQARGFLRNYARFLGFDADEMVERYDAAQGGRRRRRKRPKVAAPSDTRDPRAETRTASYTPPAEKRRGGFLGRLMIAGAGLIVLAALLIAAVVGLQYLNAGNNRSGLILSPVSPTLTPTRDLQAAPSVTPLRPTPLPIPVTPTTNGASNASGGTGSNGTSNGGSNSGNSTGNNTAPGNGVAVSLQIVERTWLRVTVDGTDKYIGAPGPGTLLQYQGTTVQVNIANAAGVDAIVNGRDYGILGARGQIVNQTFTVSGATAATPNAPPPTANSPGAASLPVSPTTTKFTQTSPGATFSLTPTRSISVSPVPTQRAAPGVPSESSTRLPTFPPTKPFTATPLPSATPSITFTPVPSRTPSNTPTPSITLTPSNTLTPSITPTASSTPTPTNTVLFLPHDTSTPEGGEIRPK